MQGRCAAGARRYCILARAEKRVRCGRWLPDCLIAVSTPLTFLQAPLHIKKAVIANDGLTLHGMPAVPHTEPEQLRLAVDS